jgi:predicted alpha-1,2-mannosidase
MAETLGEEQIRAQFDRRSASWHHLFDRHSGFLRARNADGSFSEPFDPMSTHGQGYIEGNAWNYSLFVPHDVRGLARLVGGDAKLIHWLDALFEMQVDDASIAATEDVTRAGMIGNYVHGNEPSHHVPYMYCHLGQPWKTQARVRQIMREMYRPQPDGLCGNDDVGQMSAWYVFSALGFYPVTPGSGQYVLGSPAVERAEVELDGDRTLVVTVENQSPDNVYVERVMLNGDPLDRSFVTHDELVAGGELRFVMSSTPNRERAIGAAATPFSVSR